MPAVAQSYEPHSMAWMIAENGCHQRSTVPAIEPYTSTLTYNAIGVAIKVIEDACTQRDLELSHSSQPPQTPLSPYPRTQAQQSRGPDDPHEWFFGRLGESLPSSVPPLLERDDAFFAAVQPDTCGTLPGQKEAMLARNGAVFVGSADGFVTKLVVDVAHPKQPLRVEARSARLGHRVRALAALEDGQGGWTLLAGTRRHLHRLDPTSPVLAPAGTSVRLPWEVGQPHHLTVADVLPDHPGKEVVFASQYGGLVFCDTNLALIHEWPEPGIIDFAVHESTVTILSSRNMLANVTFSGPDHTPTLVAASKIPIQLLQYLGDPPNPLPDLPCQGTHK
jgi:hypothetical protein